MTRNHTYTYAQVRELLWAHRSGRLGTPSSMRAYPDGAACCQREERVRPMVLSQAPSIREHRAAKGMGGMHVDVHE